LSTARAHTSRSPIGACEYPHREAGKHSPLCQPFAGLHTSRLGNSPDLTAMDHFAILHGHGFLSFVHQRPSRRGRPLRRSVAAAARTTNSPNLAKPPRLGLHPMFSSGSHLEQVTFDPRIDS
jgi:hypothetical protein